MPSAFLSPGNYGIKTTPDFRSSNDENHSITVYDCRSVWEVADAVKANFSRLFGVALIGKGEKMKKFFCLILATAFVMVAVGCSNESAVLPPSRVGKGTIQATFGDKYTFESALSAADVVARIEVGNWIAEDTELYKTYYEATVLECFKGNISDVFTLLQDGCSAATMEEYPLFTSGNEILVFLKEATVTEYESPYWIIGSFTTMLDVSYGEDGTRYYADRYGVLGESMDVSCNYSLEADVSGAVFARVAADDPMVSVMQYSYPYIFSEVDIEALLGNQ